MASNYFPVGLMEQPWDEDQLGTLSSLERRQRKAAEKQDVNAFYKFLGVVFVSFSLILLGSELYTVATEPSRGLTGAFLMEIGRMSAVVYGQMQNLYKAVGDIAWTGIAVVHGHDFAQRGVSITDGAAQLLARGLYYLALALSALVMYYAYPSVSRAPLRTASLSTIAAGALFGAPPLYAWLVARLCQTRSPEPVVLVALMFAAVMISASLSAARAISGRAGEGVHPQSGTARHRNAGLPRRQAAAGAAAGAGGTPNSVAAAAAGAGGGGGGGGTSAAIGGQKRGSYSRASSSGRSGGAALADPTQPSMGRTFSSASLSGHGLLSGFNCMSAAAGAFAADPVGIHASARGLHAAGNCGSSSINQHGSSSTSPQHPNVKSGPGGACGGSTSITSSAFDPVAPSVKPGRSSASRGPHGPLGSSGPAAGMGGNAGNSTSGRGATAAAKSSTNNGSKHQRQQLGVSGGAGGSADGGKAKPASACASTAAVCSIRNAALNPVSTSGAAGGVKAATARQQQQHSDPVAAPPASIASVTTHPPSSLSGSTASSSSSAAAAASKKKASSNVSSGNSSSAAMSTAAVTPATGGAAASARQQPQGPSAPAAPPGAMAAAFGGSSTASKPSRPETAAAPKLSSSAVAAPGHSLPAGAGAGAAAAAAASAPAGVPSSSAGGLMLRLVGSVASAAAASASAAPALSNRGTKKAASGTGPPTRKPQPQYVIVPPPPPPPPRKPPPAALDQTRPGCGAAAAGMDGAAASATGTVGTAAVRNAWLNPNPVIKIASGAVKGGSAKGAKGGAASVRSTGTTLTAAAASAAVAAPAPPPAAAMPSWRSGGGAPAPFSHASSTPSTRSASYGGAGFGGVTSADPPVLADRINGASPRTFPRHELVADATATIAAAPSLVGTGDLGVRSGVPGVPVAASPSPGPASSFMRLSPQTQGQLRSRVEEGGGDAVGETYITTTILSVDDTIVGPLVAHKHASGDLDIANVAANYRPYPSSGLPAPVAVPPPAEAEPTESFSLFSTPPPLITAEAAVDPVDPVAATACLASADADAAAPRVAHMLYGIYGGVYGNYAALPSLSVDPVWSHNVPSVFGAPTAGGAASRALRVPPPGFPSHAYGGAFAAGPIPGGGGWEHPAAAATTTAAATAADGLSDAVPPLPSENGVLASLGFVDDGGADSNSTSASAGGGEDTGTSCTICWSAPRQVGFLHGKTSHLCVCRRCAAKLREGVHRCPMCRQLIERIIDIY